MKTIFLYLCLAGSLLNGQSLQQRLEELLNSSFFDTTIIAVDISKGITGETVYQKNQKLLLHPASNMKIITTAAALLYLGPEYEFKTYLFGQGELLRGTFYGDIIVKGGADPDFTEAGIDSFVAVLKNKGVTRIQGNLIGDISILDSLYWGNGWMWDDDPSFDAPYLSPLTVNDNVITVNVSSGGAKEDINVEIVPNSKYMPILNNAKVVAKAEIPFVIDRNYMLHKDEIIIKGELPFNTNKSETLNVSNPALFFMTLFREKLEAAGIMCRDNPEITNSYHYKIFDTLYINKVRFDSIIVNLNKTSDNLSAEMTLRAMAIKHFGEPGNAKNGVKMIDSMIYKIGMNPSVYRMVDGSGVSHYNLVSAELLHNILDYYYKYEQESGLYELLKNSFPNAGVDGTLASRMKNNAAYNRVFAKTGTLSGVSCLSGYVINSKNEVLIFSIMMQNHYKNLRKALDIQNSICDILAE